MSFSEQLKLARIQAGLTQQQVADSMGITNSTYCGYETGKRQPDVEKIRMIAKLLNTSGDILLETGQGQSKKQSPPAPEQGAQEGKVSVDEVVRAFVAAGLVSPGQDLTDADLRFLMGVIDLIDLWFANRNQQ